MKIAFHINCLEYGGAERVVTNLSNKFVKEGYDVYITTQWQGEKEFIPDPTVKRVHLGLEPEDENKGRLYKYFKRIINLKRFVEEEKPDILIAFEKKAIYRCLMATNGKTCPVCGCVRTDPVGHYDSFLDKLRMPIWFPKATGFVFQTNGQREYFPKRYIKKSRVILNPIHQKYIDEPKAEYRKKEVVQSGRLVDFKNQAMLIDAFETVHKKHPDYVLKIYGRDSADGTKEILEEKIAAYQAEEYVKLMGNSENLEKELKYASAYAFSSDWEGLPNALMEAMALKLPIVATDCPCGGPATIMHNKIDGILIPIKDKQALADGICYLIENPTEAEKMADEAGKIANVANDEVVYKQWKEFIEELVSEKR